MTSEKTALQILLLVLECRAKEAAAFEALLVESISCGPIGLMQKSTVEKLSGIITYLNVPCIICVYMHVTLQCIVNLAIARDLA